MLVYLFIKENKFSNTLNEEKKILFLLCSIVLGWHNSPKPDQDLRSWPSNKGFEHLIRIWDLGHPTRDSNTWLGFEILAVQQHQFYLNILFDQDLKHLQIVVGMPNVLKFEFLEVYDKSFNELNISHLLVIYIWQFILINKIDDMYIIVIWHVGYICMTCRSVIKFSRCEKKLMLSRKIKHLNRDLE